jgi:hypothetical protein
VVVLEVETVVPCVLVGLVLDTFHDPQKTVEFVGVPTVVSVVLASSEFEESNGDGEPARNNRR